MPTGANSFVEVKTQPPRNRTVKLATLLLLFSLTATLVSQQTTARRERPHRNNATKQPWTFSALVDGYFVPGEQGYADPIVTADHGWLHLEGRYNYEDLHTGSAWLGYNFDFSSRNPEKQLDLTLTPMIGGVFGRTDGIAPGLEASLTYKKLNFWVSNEYVFDTHDSANNFFYTWPQLTYTPIDWLHVGFVAQRTVAIESDTEYGFLFGLTHKKTEFTSYILSPGPKPTVVLELGYNF
jgi:hypothetical protein